MATITRTETHASIRPEIRFDTEYIKTMHGYLKIAVLVLGIINLIIINSSTSNSGFFNSIAGIAFWFTLTMLALFLFHIPEKFYTLPWLPIEIGGISLISLLYFIASLIVILRPDAVATTAGIFGFATTGVYGYSGFLKFKQWKNGELAQGTLVSRSTTTTNVTNQHASAFPA